MKCSAPGCRGEAYAQGLCEPMYRRLLRRLAKDPATIKPVRKAPPRGRLVTLGVRVRASTASALEKVSETATTGARTVLEAWAKRRAR